MSTEHIQKKESGPYFQVSAFQASSVTVYGDENQTKAFCNCLHFRRQSSQRPVSIKKGSSDELGLKSKPIKISDFSEYIR